MDCQKIRDRLSAQLEKLKERYDVRKGMQFSVATEEFVALTENNCPAELSRLRERAVSGKPTHILLRAKLLALLLAQKEPKRNARANDTRLDPPKVAGETQRSKEVG